MLKISIKLFTLAILLIVNTSMRVHSQNQSMNVVMRVLSCSKPDANNFIFGIKLPLEAVQKTFSDIASSKTILTNGITKQKLINDVIKEHFESESSIVQISPNPKTKRIVAFLVRNYLNRLSTASSKLGKKRIGVEIDFSETKKIIAMKPTSHKIKGKRVYQCAIENWQIYIKFYKSNFSESNFDLTKISGVSLDEFKRIKSLKANKILYADLTKKIFKYLCYKDKYGIWHYKLEGIKAQPAFTLQQYKNIFENSKFN